MPRPRNASNKGLPTGWRFRAGAYRYQVPPPLREHWDGKSEFTLGKTLTEAYRVWSERMQLQNEARTVADLLDQYALRVLPGKSWKARESNQISLRRLRAVFGAMSLSSIEPHHAYAYIDKATAKHGKTSARRDWEVLRHAYTMAVQWGMVSRHPLLGQVRIDKPAARTRYVEDSELETAMSVAPPILRAYVEFKLLTGLRRKDILLLRLDDMKADGIHVRPSKTAKTSNKKLIIEWSVELRQVVEEARAVPRKVGSVYLFPNRSGRCYLDPETGRANGFDSLWARWIKKALDETDLELRFQERDLRAKSASDDSDIESARRRLGHTKEQITKTVYRRKGERVAPLNRKNRNE